MDTYDPILYMRTLGLLEPDVSIQKYEGFIAKMDKKLHSVDARIAEYVERQSKSFIDLSEKIGILDTLVEDMRLTEDRFTDYVSTGLNKNEELYVRLR